MLLAAKERFLSFRRSQTSPSPSLITSQPSSSSHASYHPANQHAEDSEEIESGMCYDRLVPVSSQGSMLRRRHGFRANFQEEFEKLDANGDGFLTLEELAAGLNQGMGEAELIALFNKLDVNKDGKISLDEYIMGSVNNCREHASQVHDDVSDSLNNLEHVLDDIRKDKTLDSLSKLITDSIEKRNKAVWKEKKATYRKMPFDEFKNLVNSKFDARDSSRSGGLPEDKALLLFQDLGKTFSKPDFRVFLNNNEIDHEQEISREQFLKLMLEILKEKTKFSSSVKRLMLLSQPKRSAAGRSVEDYLQQQAEEVKEVSKRAKLWKKNAVKARSFGAKSNKPASPQPVLRRAASADRANMFQWEFKRLDANGDGTLSADELFEGLKHRLGQDELSELFDNIVSDLPCEDEEEGEEGLEQQRRGWKESEKRSRRRRGQKAQEVGDRY